MRISDWSSDVCSSDLHTAEQAAVLQADIEKLRRDQPAGQQHDQQRAALRQAFFQQQPGHDAAPVTASAGACWSAAMMRMIADTVIASPSIMPTWEIGRAHV